MSRPIQFSHAPVRWDLLFLASALTFVLIYWGYCRISHAFISDWRQWPRPFPYPDKALYALERIYDSKYPVEPGYIKLHGEYPRVQATLLLAAMVPLVTALVSMLVVLYSAFRRRPTPGLSMLVVVMGAVQLVVAWYFSSIFIAVLLAQVALAFVLTAVAWIGLRTFVSRQVLS